MTTGDAVPLDRDAPLPLYVQLRDALLESVREGRLRPGDRLPGEAALGAQYAVSRATIRQALADLEAAGVVRREQGIGTFVAPPKIRHVPLLTSFSELASSQGFRPSHRVLESAVVESPPAVAAELDLAPGAPCRFLRRLLLADGDPVGLAETWLPLDVLRGRDEPFEGSLYEALEREPIALELHEASETVSPGVADADRARLLGCLPGTPVLLINRVTFAAGGRAVECTRLVFVGDRYEYRVELRR